MPTPLPTWAVWCVQPVLISSQSCCPLPAAIPLHCIGPHTATPLSCRAHQAHTAEHSTSSSTTALPEPGYPHQLQSTTPYVLGLGLIAPSYVSPSLSCLAPANLSPVEKSSTHSSVLLCAPPPPVLHCAPHIGPPCLVHPVSCSPCNCCLLTCETPARAPCTQHTHHKYHPQLQRRN